MQCNKLLTTLPSIRRTYLRDDFLQALLFSHVLLWIYRIWLPKINVRKDVDQDILDVGKLFGLYSLPLLIHHHQLALAIFHLYIWVLTENMLWKVFHVPRGEIRRVDSIVSLCSRRDIVH